MSKRILIFAVLTFSGIVSGTAQTSSGALLQPVETLDFSGGRDERELSLGGGTLSIDKIAKSSEPKEKKPAGPTEITATKGATFDQSSYRAVFIGNVKVKDAQFTLTADKLTAFMKKPAAGAEKNANGSKTSENGSGLERAIAEGNVVIVQEKIDKEGNKVPYVGKGQIVEYSAQANTLTLKGNPQVKQGINLHIATDASTVMVIDKEGELTTSGGSRTVIQDKKQEENNILQNP